jgi:hypothetical protein
MPTPGGSQTWRTFLANELRGTWAADLFVVQTVRYRIVYVLFFIRHGRRELVHFNVTLQPDGGQDLARRSSDHCNRCGKRRTGNESKTAVRPCPPAVLSVGEMLDDDC